VVIASTGRIIAVVAYRGDGKIAMLWATGADNQNQKRKEGGNERKEREREISSLTVRDFGWYTFSMLFPPSGLGKA
jgi:hypothetical protein